MKTTYTLLLSFFLLVSTSMLAQMNDGEREFAIKYLTKTQNELFKAIKGLSDEQLNFKPNAESWSIAECIRHITISETNIWAGFVDAGLATDPDPSKRSQVQFSDEQLIGVIESRAQKVKTFAPFEPSNKPEPINDVLNEFKKLRAEHIKFAKKTGEDLRNRYGQLPFGTIDVYQAMLFMSAHTKRHVDQIKEVISDANFPN